MVSVFNEEDLLCSFIKAGSGLNDNGRHCRGETALQFHVASLRETFTCSITEQTTSVGRYFTASC